MKKLQNHVNHSKLAFSCGAGAANINVFTGRVLFESPDITIGLNSYEVGVSHIFDSQSESAYDNNLGNGWKLNLHQYIEQSYENGEYVYKYFDAYGYTHIFEQYEVEKDGKNYFDRTGSGLILSVDNFDSKYKIQDPQFGQLCFENINGLMRLTQIRSGLNSSIVQYIKYNDDGAIKSVYDGRKPDRVIEFTYNEVNKLLTCIKCNKSKTFVEYTYNGRGNLVSVTKTVNSTIKNTVSYSYCGTLLKYAVCNENNSSLKFLYDEQNRVSSISDGVMKTEFKFSEPYTSLFPSDSLFAGTSYCGLQERKSLGFEVSDNDSDFVQGENYSGIYFGSSQTTVKNGKGVQTTYFFNEKGFTTGILEKAGNGKYKTLFKQTGVCVSGAGTGESINGNKSQRCTNRYDFLSVKRAEANDYFDKDINKNNCDYVLSFWVKLNEKQTNRVKAKLCLKYRYADVKSTQAGAAYVNYRYVEEYSGGSLLDCSANGGWQYVTIPFSFIRSQLKSGLFKAFNEICHLDLEGVQGDFDIADVHITPGRTPVFTFTQGAAQESVLTMEEVESIYYKSVLNDGGLYLGGGDIRNEFFMTESDITQTCMEMIKMRAAGNNTALFTLTCNAGTKKVSGVSEVQIIGNGQSVMLGFTNSGKDEYFNKSTFYVPNYITATEPSSGDNRTYTSTAYQIENNDVKTIRQHTHVLKYSDSAAASLQRKSDEYTWTDKFGRTLKKRDAYGVTNTYSYDTYGNLKKAVLSDDSGTEEVKTVYSYDADGEILLSVKDGASGGAKNVSYLSDPLYGTLTGTKQPSAGGLSENENKYTYNDYRDKLQKVELKVNGAEYGKNTLKYDETGRLCEVAGSENCKYGIKYDAFGKAVSFSLNGVELLTKEYDYAGNSITAKYHRSESLSDAVKMTHDKYGRIKSLRCNESMLIETVYQDEAGEFEESPSVANIKTMKDSAINASYTYTYDPYNGRLTEYNVQNDEMSLKVFSAGSDKIKYEFDVTNLNYEDRITYDEDCLISPRITKAYNNSNSGMDWNLSYDHLGRYSGRAERKSKSPKMTISYKSGTCLKEQIKYESENYTETITQAYDNRGNINTIKDEYSFGSYKGTNTSTYEYDDVNRLIREENTGLSTFSRTYSYDSEGNITEVKSGEERETYTYEQGRLTKIRSNIEGTKTITYDLFGNPTNYKGNAMTWERGTFLNTYKDIEYTYDGQGKLYKKKSNDRTWINYYDGNKLIAQKVSDKQEVSDEQKVSDKIIRYFYDIEGVVGFKKGTDSKYIYAKDAQGNVVALVQNGLIKARYIYDAWGNCKVINDKGEEITERDNAAVLNPIRWKSQYYDADSGLYLIEGRWYDPETGRYISSASPEMLLENASVVYALNLYALCTANPVSVMFAASTFMPELDFYYNGEYKTWWEKNGWWVMLIVGAVATVIACIAAPFTCGASTAAVAIGTTLLKIAMGTAVGAAVALAIGGTIAGVQSALTGHGFWQAFGDSVSENFVSAVTTGFAFSAVTVAASNLLKCFQCFKEGTLVQTEEGLKPIEEIEAGDKVLAYDEETGKQDYKKVVRLFRNESKDWIKVTVNGTEIESTPGHKYFLPKAKKWVSASKLKVGNKVLLSDGNYGIIQSVRSIHYDEPQSTYNFEVEDYHTYYVGAQCVCVHNQNCQFKGNKELNEILNSPEKIQDYTLDEIKAIANESDWYQGTLVRGPNKGKGFKVSSNKGSIIYNPGQVHHFDAAPYWKVSSGSKGVFRFPYLK